MSTSTSTSTAVLSTVRALKFETRLVLRAALSVFRALAACSVGAGRAAASEDGGDTEQTVWRLGARGEGVPRRDYAFDGR